MPYDSVDESIALAKLIAKNIEARKEILSQDLTPASSKRLEELEKSYEDLMSYLCRY